MTFNCRCQIIPYYKEFAMSIESRIREQKEKIKEAQRELSRLQDEARKKEEPTWYKLDEIYSYNRYPPNPYKLT